MKKLYKKFESTLIHSGKRYRLTVTAKLDDECDNKTCHFSIRDKVEVFCFGKWKNGYIENVPDLIRRRFPELKPFMELAGCNYMGQPSHPVGNGIYYFNNRDYIKDNMAVAMNCLRIDEEEYVKLLPAAKLEDKLYFKYLLFTLGIVDRWKSEADKFIEFLLPEGETWENPYTEEQEHFVLRMADEEKAEVEEKIKSGYYTEENIQKMLAEKEQAAFNKKKQEIIDKYEKETKNARNERDVKLYILEHGLPADNAIYYNHTNTVEFNWISYREKVTQEQLDNFISNLQPDKLPAGIKFVLRK